MSVSGLIGADGEARPTRRDLIIAIVSTTARLILGFLLIVFMLSLVPDAPGIGMAAPVGVALVGTAFYVVFSRRQLRRITQSKYPVLVAGEALVFIAALFLAVFAMVYVALSLGDPSAFTEPLDAFTSYYFALTVLATVGFGDITPVTTGARAVTMVQMALDLVFIAALIRVVSMAARKGRARRAQSAMGPGEAPGRGGTPTDG